MHKEWKEYYLYLEELRQSGITNMYGAAPYLAEEFNLKIRDAREILCNWMNNYEEISKEYYNE